MKKSFMNARMLSLMTVLLVFLAGCGKNQLSALTPAGEVGQEQFNLMMLAVAIMALVVLVVTVLFTIAVVKSRRSKLGEDFQPKQVEGNHTLETIWTGIPIILLFVLAIPTVYLVFKQADVSEAIGYEGEVNAEEIVINVRAYQYWWEFEYPSEGVVTAQDLVVPTDRRVYFNLQGADVKHSFWIPAAGGKLDTNIDGINSFYLVFDDEKSEEADRLFYGKCAELCGPSHALMDFKVEALPEDEFNQWLADMQTMEEPAQASTDDAANGQEIFNNSCIGCHAVTTSGSAGAPGPNLTNFADRTLIAGFKEFNEENLVNWIKDPEKYKPGNKMTGTYDLTDEEIELVAQYLLTLSVEEGSGDVSNIEELRNPSDDSEEDSDEESEEDEDSDEEDTEDDEEGSDE